jgi:hypothetical protein
MVVDRTTANLPWELMLADDASRTDERKEPMAIKTRFIRQLAETEFRRQVRQNTGRTALVVGDPSTSGFAEAFSSDAVPISSDPPELDGAREEAESIAQLLQGQGYVVKPLVSRDSASSVLSALYHQPWRIVHISAHGIFGLPHKDGRLRSGVVLSDGLLITAAEIDAMELVPEVVFLNCCHLGTVDGGTDGNKLAASIARELIGIGVRCVVVAGWAVDDELARLFGETFYKALLLQRKPFGEAVWLARRATWVRNPQNITWGAFQAYGDPDWLAEPGLSGAPASTDERFASPDELLDRLATLRVELARRSDRVGEADAPSQVRRLEALVDTRCQPSWRQLPEVQSALGAAWYDLGEFGRAREELLAAVRAEDRFGRVPLRDIEKLANAEARFGEQTADLLMIQGAIQRLEGIDLVMAPPSAADSSDEQKNAERCALRGSAHKRMASVAARLLIRAERSDEALADGLHAEVEGILREALEESAASYAAAEGRAGHDDLKPYLALNRLALDALTLQRGAERDARIALARACAQRAAAAFALNPNFWDAVMVPEALLVERMLDRSLFLEGEAGDAVLGEVWDGYSAALRDVPAKPGELNSVATQLELLALFLRALSLGSQGDAAEARGAARLLALLQRLQPQRPLPALLAPPPRKDG